MSQQTCGQYRRSQSVTYFARTCLPATPLTFRSRADNLIHLHQHAAAVNQIMKTVAHL